jgi:hypothetical protein
MAKLIVRHAGFSQQPSVVRYGSPLLSVGYRADNHSPLGYPRHMPLYFFNFSRGPTPEPRPFENEGLELDDDDAAWETRAFQTEVEAKKFANVMLSKGMKVTAGTLNPHLPTRRMVEASEIER